MIPYEIVLQLNNETNFCFDHNKGCEVESGGACDCKHLLAELIDYCGEKFEALIKQAGGWVAISNKEHYMMKQNFKAVPTPEVAVAKLVIRLDQ